MEGILSTVFYYVLIPLVILGIAINIHEFGHFLVAKLFGMPNFTVHASATACSPCSTLPTRTSRS